jgi:CubicO group peptidase (beta-lactamase class C family)
VARPGPLLALAVVVALVAGCSATATPPAPELTPLSAGIEAFLAADDDGRYDQLRAVVVEVAGERRYVRGDPTSRGDVHSVTKSVLATLIGIAVDRGQIAGVDRTLDELLPAYATVMPVPMRAATLRQLLTMTAGIPGDGARDADPPAPTDDWARYALTLGPQHPPGAGFVYSTTSSHLLSAVLTRATGLSTLDYARQQLFAPLGISADPGWATDPQGRQQGGTGLALSAEEMLALGRLYLAGGSRDGEQIVSATWVADATSAHVRTGGPLPGYGYQWWVTTAAGHPAFAAQGLGGQLVEVVPELALVVVVRSDTGDHLGAPPETYAGMVDTVIAPAVG